jgi:hypothetical protein
MRRNLSAFGTKFAQIEALGIVPAILFGSVVAHLALATGESNYDPGLGLLCLTHNLGQRKETFAAPS